MREELRAQVRQTAYICLTLIVVVGMIVGGFLVHMATDKSFKDQQLQQVRQKQSLQQQCFKLKTNDGYLACIEASLGRDG